MRCEHLDTFPMWFAVSRKGKLAGATSLADLQDAEWLHTGPSAEFRAFRGAVRAGRPAGARRATRCASQTLFYALAVNSDVVTAWTQLALRSEDASDTLKTLDLVGQPPARNPYLLFRDSAVLTSSAEYFVRCIDEAVQAERANAGGKKRGTRRVRRVREMPAYGATRDNGTASSRSFSTSRPGASPNRRAYSRLNCDALT